MASQGRTILKSFFQTGDRPTEAQFADLIDSMFNLEDDDASDIAGGLGGASTLQDVLGNGNSAGGNAIADLANPTNAQDAATKSWTETQLGSYLPRAGGTMTGAFNQAQATNLASASTVNIGAANGNVINITGTTTINAFDTIAAGAERILEFQGILTLTHNATSLILPTGANITTAAGDVARFVSEGSGNWRCVGYMRANGTALAGSGSTTDLSGIPTSSATASTPTFFDASKNLVSMTAALIGTWWQTLSGKSTPVDADTVGMYDSASSFAGVKVTLVNFWNNYIKPKADALYVLLSNYVTLSVVTGSPNTLTWNTANQQLPLAKSTVSVTSFTLVMQNVKSGSNGILKIITGTASAITITFDASFTNEIINSALTTYTFPAGNNREYFLSYLADGTTLEWTIADGVSGTMPTGTSSQVIVYNASNNPAAVNMSGDATITNGGVLTVSNSAISLAKMANLANNKVIGNNSGGTAAPSALDTQEMVVSNSTVQTALNTESGWSNNQKTVANIVAGQWWIGTNLTSSIVYRYDCVVDGTAYRTPTGQAFDIATISAITQPIYQAFADLGNSGTTETDIFTYTIPAAGGISNLDVNGKKILLTNSGTVVGSATATRQLRAYFGGTLIYDSTALTMPSNSDYFIEVTVIRVSASVVRCYTRSIAPNNSISDIARCKYTEVTGLTLANAQIIKITGTAAGTGAATNDIVSRAGEIRYVPNA